ncbi:glycosyltransferase family 4 protein [Rhizobiaceae bacterium n13]|uniref:Glycosyltransferase family 4 protein n=1 Tax=Ferirhizobium litorale TaxID=2927786 RepID=A0AAE3QDH4_9HYPH|nr:glycosyltransferase family 4 protein [Fererhizobium litorale]MDI7861825.1 glycosyltransferase family 4 protein [Fererhizobium litorale]MDI7921833.1 glycosyltransferase family 4 protein [Fererhizobium litorale]
MSALVAALAAEAPTRSAGPLVVHVVRQYAPNRGGLEDVVANICQQSLKRNYRVRVVTCNTLFADPGRKLSEREAIDGVEVVRIPWRGSSRYPIAPQVLRHLADADLVHVHAIDFFFDALSLARFVHRKPLIATTHGGFFHTRKFRRAKEIWFRTLTRLSAGGYRAIVSCSQADARLFSTIASGRLALIENGTDTHKFADAASIVPQRRMVTIGRFSANKRLDRLLDGMAALAASQPGWHLDIAGAPSDFSAADLQREIDARNLAGNVALHVSIDNAAIRDLIAKASYFVSASEYEGFGLVAVEAMSAGLLPVLQPNEAYRHLAARHRAITLCDFTRAEGFAETMSECFERLSSGQLPARRTIVDQAKDYSWDTVADKYFEIYERVLG